MNRYSELKINNVVLIREKTRGSLNRRIRECGLSDVVKSNNAFQSIDVIASAGSVIFGTLFEGKKL
jgi:hypothetical protein